MRTRSLGFFLSPFVFLILAAATVPISNAQQGPQLDRGSIRKTRVPFLSTTSDSPRVAAFGNLATTTATFKGTPYNGGVVVTPTTTIPQAEEHIAVHPSDYRKLVAVVSDFALRGGFNTTKFAASTDNGLSWADGYVPLDGTSFPMTTGNLSWEANSSPAVAIDKQGRVYLSSLYLNVSNGANGVYVSAGNLSSAGLGLSAATTRPVYVTLDPLSTTRVEKPWIAVDNSGFSYENSVYVSWTHFASGTDMILLARSLDYGATWTTPVQVSAGAHDGAVHGSQVATGPRGEVYVIYEVFYVNSLRQHFLAKSTDGGQTFAPPVAVTPFFNELSFLSPYGKFSFASLAVSPTGHIYVVYPDQPSDALGAEVEFVRSTTPGGMAFTTPVVINDKSTGQQFMSAITVDTDGIVHTMWFDTRRNPNRPDSQYDIYGTRSTDGGATFSSNSRLSDGAIDAGSANFIGFYAGIAAGGGYAHPVWTNGGFNNGSLQTRTLR